MKSPKLAAQYMLQKVMSNVITVTGRNVRLIKDIIGHEYDVLKVNPTWLRNKVKFCEISENDKWRIDIIKEIVNIKQTVLELTPAEVDDDSFLTSDQLTEILDFVSCS